MSPIERSTVRASSRPSTSSYSMMWSRRTATPPASTRVDEAARGKGGQRHLSVAALGLEAALDDRELAPGGRVLRALRERNVKAEPGSEDRLSKETQRRQKGSPGARSSTEVVTSTGSRSTIVDSMIRTRPGLEG